MPQIVPHGPQVGVGFLKESVLTSSVTALYVCKSFPSNRLFDAVSRRRCRLECVRGLVVLPYCYYARLRDHHIHGTRFGQLSRWYFVLEMERRLMVLPDKSGLDSDVPS